MNLIDKLSRFGLEMCCDCIHRFECLIDIDISIVDRQKDALYIRLSSTKYLVHATYPSMDKVKCFIRSNNGIGHTINIDAIFKLLGCSEHGIINVNDWKF